MSRRFQLHHGRGGSALAVRVTPRAARAAVAGVQTDGTVRIQVTAPAIDDRANQALIAFLAEVLGIARSHIEIVAGRTGRDKLISIVGMDAPTAQAKILAQMK